MNLLKGRIKLLTVAECLYEFFDREVSAVLHLIRLVCLKLGEGPSRKEASDHPLDLDYDP